MCCITYFSIDLQIAGTSLKTFKPNFLKYHRQKSIFPWEMEKNENTQNDTNIYNNLTLA